jgi:predicted nucleic acid-binding protein
VSLFVDSSAFFAAAYQPDRHHGRAVEILRGRTDLVTTDHVLVESWLLLRHRAGRAVADRFWAALRGGAAAIETVGLVDLEAAFAIGAAFPDQDFSIVNRTSFAVMERLGIHRVATFDDDFAIYRYGPRRDRAFEVLR